MSQLVVNERGNTTGLVKTWNWNETTKYRSFMMTVNNWNQQQYDYIINSTNDDRKPKCVYVAVSKEGMGEGQTPHLHVLIYFKDNHVVAKIRNKYQKMWVEPCSPNSTFKQRWEYITKTRENDPGRDNEDLASPVEERGVRPPDDSKAARNKKGGVARGEQVKEEWEKTRELARSNRLDEIDAQHYVVHYNNLKRIARDSHPKPDRLPTPARKVHFEWWYGPPGAGKSMGAEHLLSSIDEEWYDKPPQAKWVDENISPTAPWRINDLDRYQSKHLGGLLKTWAEESPFQAETKGGLMWARPCKIIVTSNPAPWEIWDDSHTIDAILDRFKIVYWPSTYVPDMEKPDPRVDEIHPPWKWTAANQPQEPVPDPVIYEEDFNDLTLRQMLEEDEEPLAAPVLTRCDATKSIWQPAEVLMRTDTLDLERAAIGGWINEERQRRSYWQSVAPEPLFKSSSASNFNKGPDNCKYCGSYCICAYPSDKE